jgi:ribosomal-protein-alanine N-acetyltransferase
MTIITQTSRLIIREFLPEEEEAFFALMTDERLTAYLPKRNNEQIHELFSDTLAAYQAGNKLIRWGIFNADDFRFIGMCILKHDAAEPGKAELGYVIHHDFKGMGIATEISKALLTYGFADMELNEIFAVTDKANIPSQKVLLKAGLKQGPDMERHGMMLSFFNITAIDWLNEQKRHRQQ